MKKILLVLGLLLLVGFAYAALCGDETITGEDCNVMVLGTPDTIGCDLNVFNVDGTTYLTNTAMISMGDRRFAYTINDSNEGDWVYTVECNGNGTNWGGSSFKIVDSNVHDLVDTLEAGQTTITGNQATLQTEHADINGLVADINEMTHDINGNVNTDLNVDIYISGGGTTPAAVWAYATRDLSDYNQLDLFNYLSDLNMLVDDINSTGANDVWIVSTRDLTDYNMTDLLQYLSDINMLSGDINSTSADDVWIVSNRDLTDYNQNELYHLVKDTNDNINTDLNVSLYEAGGLTAANVWGYATRDLTDYNQNDLYHLVKDTNDNVNVDLNYDLYASSGITPASVWSYVTRDANIIDSNALAADFWGFTSRPSSEILQWLADAIWGNDALVTIWRFINGTIP